MIGRFPTARGHDQIGGAIGLACVGFVMTFLWWKHRDLKGSDDVVRQAVVGRPGLHLVLRRGHVRAKQYRDQEEAASDSEE
jgi:hypothetical protein